MKKLRKTRTTNLRRDQIGKGYWAVWKIAGKTRIKSLGTTDRVLAEEKLHKVIPKGRKLDASDLATLPFAVWEPIEGRKHGTLVGGLAHAWLSSVWGGLGSNSRRRYLQVIKKLHVFFGSEPANLITGRRCDAWGLQRLTPNGPNGFNSELKVLKAVFKYAVEEHLLLEDPAARMKKRKGKGNGRLAPKPEELTRVILDMRENAPLEAEVAEFLATSSLRISEVLGDTMVEVEDMGGAGTKPRKLPLAWSAVTWGPVTWGVHDYPKGCLEFIAKGKGGGKVRSAENGDALPLFEPLRDVLERRRSRLPAPPDPTGPIFPGTDKFKFTESIRASCDRCGVSRFSAHHLRHYFATEALRGGAHVKTVSWWLGHSDGGVLVLRIYGHLCRDHATEQGAIVKAVAPPENNGQVLPFPMAPPTPTPADAERDAVAEPPATPANPPETPAKPEPDAAAEPDAKPPATETDETPQADAAA